MRLRSLLATAAKLFPLPLVANHLDHDRLVPRAARKFQTRDDGLVLEGQSKMLNRFRFGKSVFVASL